MTVSQLIKLLKKYDGKMPIMVLGPDDIWDWTLLFRCEGGNNIS